MDFLPCLVLSLLSFLSLFKSACINHLYIHLRVYHVFIAQENFFPKANVCKYVCVIIIYTLQDRNGMLILCI